MTLNVGINGFGRIGRGVFRALLSQLGSNVRVVAINDLAPPDLLAHLLRHDTVYGRWLAQVRTRGSGLEVNGDTVVAWNNADPAQLDWAAHNVDIVIEATGMFTTRSAASAHLRGGARAVVITAPAPDADATILFGTNHNRWSYDRQRVVSAGSCTAHAVAPLVSTVCREFGWHTGHMTTVHPVTPDQSVAQRVGADWRQVRGSLAGVIPKTTSAIQVISDVLPEVRGRFDGLAYRIPTLSPGVVDLVVQVRRETSRDRVLRALEETARVFPPGVFHVSHERLVSADYVGDFHSSTVDAALVHVTNGTQVHVSAWYDNEAGYAHRLADLLRYAADHHAGARQPQHRRRALVCGSTQADDGRDQHMPVPPTRVHSLSGGDRGRR